MQILMLRFLQPEVTLRPLEHISQAYCQDICGFFSLPILLLSIQTWMQLCFHYVGLLSICFPTFVFFSALSSAKIHHKLQGFQLGKSHMV